MNGKNVKSPLGKQLNFADKKIKFSNFIKIGEHYYEYMKIGNQLWITENLREPIGTEGVDYWWYDNDQETYEPRKAGIIYTWYAVHNGDNAEMSPALAAMCPEGWHIPTLTEFNELFGYCGGEAEAYQKLRAKSDLWPDGGGTDDYGFNALPTGWHRTDAGFGEIETNFQSFTLDNDNQYPNNVQDVCIACKEGFYDRIHVDRSHYKDASRRQSLQCGIRLVYTLPSTKKLLKTKKTVNHFTEINYCEVIDNMFQTKS